MKLKKHIKEYYKWDEIVDAVEAKSGKDTRDWAGKYKNKPTDKDYLSGNFPAANWAKSKGYNWEVLNDNPDGTPRTEEEVKLRIKINEEYNLVEKEYETPYQDFWHYAIDHLFPDVHNGTFHYFNPSEHLEEIKDEDLGEHNFVKEILPYFIEILKENRISEEVEVYISW